MGLISTLTPLIRPAISWGRVELGGVGPLIMVGGPLRFPFQASGPSGSIGGESLQ